MPHLRLFVLLVLAAVAWPTAAQRPLPHPVPVPPQVQRAIDNGTRTRTGQPGGAYWQNRASYDIQARLDETTATLDGQARITYVNASPDALPFLVLKLRQNIHAPGVPRNRPVTVTGGATLSQLRVAGRVLEEVSGRPAPGQYQIDGTVLTLALQDTLASGGSVTLDVAWSYPVPPHTGAFRQGQDGEVYYLGYWYPQLAVYDDVYGWHTDPYLGAGEHYMGYADYTLALDMPAGWLVWATGDLQNPDAVLAPTTRERLARAQSSDDVVHVVTSEERGRATAPGSEGRLLWQFRAQNVRDVAVSTSAAYLWDATRALVDKDEDGTQETVLINTFYRPGTAAWNRSAEFARFSVEHLSESLFPYPWPHMTVVEGLISGGMEYPMMTVIGGDRTDQTLFRTTYHEIGHMWYPMIVGTNEKAYTWMDEGLTTYNTAQGVAAFFDGSTPTRPLADAWARARQAHYLLAGTGYAQAPMRHNDQFRVGGGTPEVDPIGGSARRIASYSTPAVLLRAMEGIWGSERFYEAFRAYGRAWRYKHPLPTDFFNAMEATLGEDLDWLWTPTLYDTWTVDQAVGEVTPVGSGVRVVVRDEGLAPMPATVRVTFLDGSTETQTVPVATWLAGATETTLTFRPGDVARVEIDPDGILPDTDREDNVRTFEPPGQ